mmetsp:Transcript_21039/g.46174  ORF Transcript_21039/g.46174 Transcript_21039/m.46174 type:complete len:248 (-) Transcript_21039:538-1281(-)
MRLDSSSRPRLFVLRVGVLAAAADSLVLGGVVPRGTSCRASVSSEKIPLPKLLGRSAPPLSTALPPEALPLLLAALAAAAVVAPASAGCCSIIMSSLMGEVPGEMAGREPEGGADTVAKLGSVTALCVGLVAEGGGEVAPLLVPCLSRVWFCWCLASRCCDRLVSFLLRSSRDLYWSWACLSCALSSSICLCCPSTVCTSTSLFCWLLRSASFRAAWAASSCLFMSCSRALYVLLVSSRVVSPLCTC